IITKDVKDATLLVMSENGFGKRTEIEEYKTQKRGGSGIKTAKVTAKTGDIVVASLITPEVSEIIAISKKGQVIKTDLDSISILGRQTQGVKIMKPRAGDSLASLTCL
ncbi:MAG: gyrase subunit, partial [Patescibacteria group bacterium]|nr:gyrase subunit [Patescibacteria group bacterium]